MLIQVIHIKCFVKRERLVPSIKSSSVHFCTEVIFSGYLLSTCRPLPIALNLWLLRLSLEINYCKRPPPSVL